MAITKALFAGDDPTPEGVKRRRALAEQLLAEAGGYEPLQHPLQAVAKVLNAGVAGYKQRQADADEKAGMAKRSSAMNSMLGSLLTGGSAIPSSAIGGSAMASYEPSAAGSIASGPAASVPAGERAGYIRSGLVNRGLPEHVADAFLVNFQDESGLNPDINEAAPIVPGSRGGYGLYQLTGPRRRQYEAFAAQRGVGTGDIDAQLDFLMTELSGSEKRAGQRILSAPDTATAAQAIVNDFLRPAEQHRSSRAARYARMSGAPVQVASNDPTAGVREAFAASGRQAPAQQAISDMMGGSNGIVPASIDPREVPGLLARRDPNAVAYNGPGQIIEDRDVAALRDGSFGQLSMQELLAGAGEGQRRAALGAQPRPGIELGTGPVNVPNPNQAPGPMPVQPVAPTPIASQQYDLPPVPTPAPQDARQALASQLIGTPAASPAPVDPWQGLREQDVVAALGNEEPAAARAARFAADGGGSAQTLSSQLLAGSPQPAAPAAGGNRALIAQLLGDPWTEDLGQQLLSREIENQQWLQRQQFETQQRQGQLREQRAYDAGLRQDERAYERMTEQEKRAYDAGLRQEEYGRQDQRYQVEDQRADRDFALRVEEANEPPVSIQEYEYARQQGYEGSFAQFEESKRKAGATTINTGSNSSKFQEESDKAAATRLNEVIVAGNAAPQLLGDIQQLASLGQQIQTGRGAEVMVRLGPYAEALGFSIEGLGPAEAYQSIIARIAPQMRPAGAGATSDFDARQFLQSLPALGNTPEGNRIISDTFRAIQQNKMRAAEIASLAMIPKEQGGLSWQDAEKQIRSLPNPFAGYQQFTQAREKAATNPNSGVPANVDPADWEFMTPEERALFQ